MNYRCSRCGAALDAGERCSCGGRTRVSGEARSSYNNRNRQKSEKQLWYEDQVRRARARADAEYYERMNA